MAKYGQIPKYGDYFRLEHSDVWHPEMNHSVYVLKRDPKWFIRSDKTSKKWWIFFMDPSNNLDNAIKVSARLGSLSIAMQKLTTGITYGFYEVTS